MTLRTLNGWAVIDGSGINIKTVSDTHRAAVVNWLVVERGLMIYSHYDDARIERMWRENCGDAICTPVEIRAPH